jgi:hypothetical protein
VAAIDLADHRDRKIRAGAAVDGARFNVRGIAIREPHVDAAVLRFYLEALAVPSLAPERHLHAAVLRPPFEIASNVGQDDPPVLRPEIRLRVDNSDRRLWPGLTAFVSLPLAETR